MIKYLFHGKKLEDMSPYPFASAVRDICNLGQLERPATIEDMVEGMVSGELSDSWKCEYITTTSGIAYRDHTLQQFKILPEGTIFEYAFRENGDTERHVGMEPEEYQKIPKREFNRSKLLLNKELSKRQALKHPLWRELLLENTKLLKKFVEKTYQKMRDERNQDTAMGIYLPDPSQPEKEPTFEADDFPIGKCVINPLHMVGPDVVDQLLFSGKVNMLGVLANPVPREEYSRAKKILNSHPEWYADYVPENN